MKNNNVEHLIKLPKKIKDDLKIGIVVSRFNYDITNKMSSLCRNRLIEIGIKKKNILLINVPGSYELPYAIKSLIINNKLNSVIALGAIIKGETTHYETITYSVGQSLINLSTETLTPIIFGVLTTETTKQATERINQAIDYAEIAIEMGSKKFK